MATKQAILEFLNNSRSTQAVPVAGFGEVHVRMINCGERIRMQAAMGADSATDTMTSALVMLSFGLSDERGQPLFDEGDTASVGCFDVATIDRASEAFIDLNKLRSNDVDELVSKA